jgi:hypothetical protein
VTIAMKDDARVYSDMGVWEQEDAICDFLDRMIAERTAEFDLDEFRELLAGFRDPLAQQKRFH